AITFNHTPVHVCVVEVVKIPRRDAIDFGTADIGANGDDQIVPPATGCQQGRHRNIRLLLGALAYSSKKLLLSGKKLSLATLRKAKRKGAPPPGGWRFVDRSSLFFGDLDPRVAIGGM